METNNTNNTLTPKEKADILVSDFLQTIIFSIKQNIEAEVLPAAIQCAILTVDRLISCTKNGLGHTIYSKEYWVQVKEELIKMKQ
jgi:hypothetical protein